MRTYLQSKAMAKSLRESLAAKNVALSHSECLEIVAKQFGFGEWNTLAAKIDTHTGSHVPRESRGVEMQQPIPVLRIGAVRQAKEFYADYLGFEFGWGETDAADGDQPAYVQILRSGVEIHLDQYQHDGLAGTVALIRMSGLDALQRELSSKHSRFEPPQISYTPYDSRVMVVKDPFGNYLRFWENNPPGVAWEESKARE